MPSVLRIKGFRFFFYAEEGNEPIHIHVAKGGGEAKIWLKSEVQAHYFNNFKISEQREIMKLININYNFLITKWYELFKNI